MNLPKPHRDDRHPSPAARNHLTSVANDRVKAVLRLRQPKHRRRTGLFIAEGVREVTRALTAHLQMLDLFWCPSLFDPHHKGLPDWLATPPKPARVWSVSEGVLAKLAYRQNPEGVLAVFEQPHWPSLAELCGGEPMTTRRRGTTPDVQQTNTCGGYNGLWLVASGIEKPGNLGALARSAAAAGCRGLILENSPADPFNPNAIHASTGAVFDLPVVAVEFDELIQVFSRRGVALFALAPEARQRYDLVDWVGPAAIVVGSEDRGLGDRWLTLAQDPDPPARLHCVSIPMAHTAVDSLNASVAAAIVLFEAVRQRRNHARSRSSHTTPRNPQQT